MKKITTLVFCIVSLYGTILAQTNLITNPGFEAAPASFTVPIGTPTLNNLMKVINYNSTITETTQPVATSISVSDGLWLKKQSVSSSVISAYLASGGANGSANYLFMKVGGGSGTIGIDWTKFSVQQRLSLSNSTVYTFSFWAKVGAGISTAYAYIADKNGNTGGASFYKTIPLTGGTTWTKYTMIFDIPAIRSLNAALDYTTAYVGVGMTPAYTTATPPLTANSWLYVDDFELYAASESLVPTITSSALPNVYIKTNPIPITITFNAPVTGFTSSDLVVTNGVISNFSTTSATTYTADLIPTATGKVTVDIAAGAAVNSSSNQSVAATQFVRFFNNEVSTGNYSVFTTVCPIKDNKKAVYTFTSDDGFTNAATFFNSEFNRLNLCGSLALVANWINGSQTPASTYSFWNSLLADGKFDIINHSKSHVKFSTISNLPTGQDSLYNEIIGNQSVFRSKLPGQDIITMANPAVVNTDAADVLIKQSHYAARNGSSGYNSLSPTDTEWFKLNMLANYFPSKSRAAYSTEINKYVDNVITNKQWLILLTHGIGTGANAMQDTAFTKHFEYVATKTADLWVGKLGDVTRYFREKQNVAVLTVDSTASSISISITHMLDAQRFNYPLTLKTRVPDAWTNVSVTQNLVTKNVISVVESGTRYIYYDAVPNVGHVVLAPSNVLAIGSVPDNRKSTIYYQSANSSLVLRNLKSSKTIVSLANLSGKEVFKKNISQSDAKINLSGLKSGVYLVSCHPEKGSDYGLKIVKD